MKTQIHVMAGALSDAEGRILVARRPDTSHQGGLWEFPGGKLEPGEGPEAGLARELAEELGITVFASRPLIRIHHDYGDRHILLDVHRVEAYGGTPRGLEGQPLDWVHPQDMDPEEFPAADRPIITALRLPALFLITGPDARARGQFEGRIRRALASGIRLVQLRAHDLDDADYRGLAAAVFDLCEQAEARLILNRDPARLGDCPRHGVHLTARALAGLAARPGDPADLVGASCHDAMQLQRAAALGLDYALLSPVRDTATHPSARPLGWERFAALTDPVPLPVYALGGLDPTDLQEAVRHGAQGIAAIRGLWPD
jgi:8-oxo-dGTP diphosphatase